MNLGFYYHITLYTDYKGLNVPAYLGLFIDSLANEVEFLTLFMHEATVQEAVKCDYILKAQNIKFVSLGKKTPAWERFLWPGRTIRQVSSKVKGCDVLLVRAPSPLAPAFNKFCGNTTKVCYMIVGDYALSSQYLDQPWLRKKLIIVLSKRNDRQLSKEVGKTISIVNSTILYNKYKKINDQVFEIKTTTLSEEDFFKRADTCCEEEIKVLYTGRIDFSKGLRELILGIGIVIKEKINVSLHLAGWEDDATMPVEKLLRKTSVEEGIENRVHFYGRKTLGKELNKIYRMADIYVIPSYQEGFPRTIWEAMANCLPVVATRVGSIPLFLKDHENVLLIDPKSKEAVAEAILKIINNAAMRRNMIANGFVLARENTLEIQAKRIVKVLVNSSQ